MCMVRKDLLNRAEILLKAGRVDDAVRVLASDPATYNAVVNGVIIALASAPGGVVADLNGNLWPVQQLISLARSGQWTAAPPLANFLLSEIELLK